MMPFQLTVIRLMTLVACIAVTLAAFRLHISIGSFVAFVAMMGPYRAFVFSDQCRAAGHPLSSAKAAMNVLRSVHVATIILVVSTASALFMYYFMDHVEKILSVRSSHPPKVSFFGVSAALPTGWIAASWSRRLFWSFHHGEESIDPASLPDRSLLESNNERADSHHSLTIVSDPPEPK